MVMDDAGSPAGAADIDREEERARLARFGKLSMLGAFPFTVMLCIAGSLAARNLFPGTAGFARDLTIGGLAAIFAIPFALTVYRLSLEQNLKISRLGEENAAEMTRQARRREFETHLANALEMAEGEPEVLDAIQRAITVTLPDAPAELLLADNSHAHLSRMVTASPTGEPPGCSVQSPQSCPAARRAQVQRFPDSEDLDACPKLRDRPQGRRSAVCVPVSIMGRTVGVIHATDVPRATVDEARLLDLQTLANLAGNRIGMIRIMAETQLQASTDSLTGLVNRRTLESRVQALRTESADYAFAMTDLDHFKDLNDTYGHETGDRALRLFASTLRQQVRSEDTVCRYGGEEFAIVLPRATVSEATEVLERVRHSLALAISSGGSPSFTASFGIAHSSSYADFDEVVARADQALFQAKDAGRNCIWLDGETTPTLTTPTTWPALVPTTSNEGTA
jgi:diguanylate cyclase (GGDEF)-like protein